MLLLSMKFKRVVNPPGPPLCRLQFQPVLTNISVTFFSNPAHTD